MQGTDDGTRLLLSTPIAQAELRAPTPASVLRRSLRYSPFPTDRRTAPNEQERSPDVNVRLFQSPARSNRARTNPPSRQPSAQKTGRPRDDIWDHYYIERDGSKKHGRCRYCKYQVKNGKPSQNLLKHLQEKCPAVSQSVKDQLQKGPPATQAVAGATPTTQPGQPDAMTQDEFDLALAHVFFVCSLPFLLIEAQVFRDFLSRLAPHVKLPSRKRLSGTLLELATRNLREKVVQLISDQGHVSVVTDGWSDPNGSSIINFMVVAPGMPSLFWSSWSTHSERHTAKYMAREMERVIDEIQSQTTATVTGIVTDNAKNMTSAWRSLMKKLPNVIGGGCAAHVLNLLMQDVCQHQSIKSVQVRAVAITRFVKDHLALLDQFKSIQQSARTLGSRARGLVLPVPTRWYSVHACLRNVLNSRDQLEELFLSAHYAEFRERYQGTAANRNKLNYIIAVLRDDNFWTNIRAIVRLTEPIIEALRELESDKSYASSVYKWFRKLKYHEAYGVCSREEEAEGERQLQQELERQQDAQAHREHDDDGDDASARAYSEAELLADLYESDVPVPLLESTAYTRLHPIALDELQPFFRKRIQARWEYVHTNAMGVAFFLDPTTDMDDFVGEDEERARNQACALAQRSQLFPKNTSTPELMAELLKFARVKRRGGEDRKKTYSKTAPRDYWDSEKKNYPALARIAEVVFSIPTSSAASERAWSIFDHIHTKKRNRLSVKKVEMLAFMYINYGTTQKEMIDLARHQSRPESIDLDDAPWSPDRM